MLSLSSDLHAHSGRRFIIDRPLGIKHPVYAPGDQLIAKLSAGIRTDEFRKEARRLQITDSQYTELLGFINAIGGLVRKRRISAWPRAIYHQSKQLVLGVHYSILAWRRPASIHAILVGTVRASIPVPIAISLLCVFMQVTQVAPISLTAPVASCSFGIFVCSLWLHELAHVAVAQTNGMQAVVLQKGMRLGVVHGQMTAAAEICSAILGPFIGIAAALGLSALLGIYIPALSGFGLIASTVQLGSLLPWYGDGQSLKKALQK